MYAEIDLGSEERASHFIKYVSTPSEIDQLICFLGTTAPLIPLDP